MFVKICGITSEDDALLAVALGADAVGFVFAPSKRQIAADRARDIARRLPPEILTVGVFRDELADQVVDVVNRAGLRAAQLHGQESPDVAASVRARVPVTIKAFPASRAGQALDYDVDAILVDSAEPGSGKTFDWSTLGAVDRRVPMLLAGGLNPTNVGDAIARVRPWGVDVSSGVESGPGRKDPRKLRDFILAAREAAAHVVEDASVSGVTERPFDWQQHQ